MFEMAGSRPFRLEALGIQLERASVRQTKIRVGGEYLWRAIRKLNRALPANIALLIQEGGPRFHPKYLMTRGYTYITGYWQCERYFSTVADELRSELRVATDV